MDKASFTTLIDENLESESLITAEKHREVEFALVDEFFADIKIERSDSAAENTIIIPLISGLQYELCFKKSGNIVYFSGSVGRSGGITANSDVFQIVDSAYIPIHNTRIIGNQIVGTEMRSNRLYIPSNQNKIRTEEISIFTSSNFYSRFFFQGFYHVAD